MKKCTRIVRCTIVFVVCSTILFPVFLSFHGSFATLDVGEGKSTANDSKIPWARYLKQKLQGTDEDSQKLSVGDNTAWFGSPSTKLPSVLIVGAKNCGTSALKAFLGTHPKVKLVKSGLNFFSEDGLFNHGLDWYRSQMPVTVKDDVCLQKAMTYTSPKALPRLRRFLPNAKFIWLVCEPVQRAVSHYVYKANVERSELETRQSFEKCSTFENVMGAFVNTSWGPIQDGYYDIQLRKWLEVFPRNQIILLNGDDLREDPYPHLKRLESELNLPDYFRPDHFVFNSNIGYYCFRGGRQSQLKCLGKRNKHPGIRSRVLNLLRFHYRLHMHVFFQMVNETFPWL